MPAPARRLNIASRSSHVPARHRRWLLTWALTFIGLLVGPQASLAQTSPPLRPVVTDPVVAGTSFWIDVVAGTPDASVTDLYGLSFALQYDPTHVSIVRTETGPFLNTSLIDARDDVKEGLLRVGLSRTTVGVTGSGAAVRVLVSVRDDTPTSTPLSFRVHSIEAINSAGDTVFLNGQSLVVPVGDVLPPMSTIEPVASTPALPGELFAVEVQVGTATSPVNDLVGTSFELSYDPSKLTLVDAEAGSFFGSSLFSYDDAGGTVGVGVSRTGTAGRTGTGDVARLTFRVVPETRPGSRLLFTLQNVVSTARDGNRVRLDPVDLSTTVEATPVEALPFFPEISGPLVAGRTVWVNVHAGTSDLPIADLYGTSFRLRYNPAYLSVVDHESGPFFGSNVVYQGRDDPDAGSIGIGVSRTDSRASTGAGVVARIQFLVRENTPVGTEVTLTPHDVRGTTSDGFPIGFQPSVDRERTTDSVPSSGPLNLVASSPQPSGGSFWVDVVAGSDAEPMTDLYGVSFTLSYDADLLTVVDSEHGPFMGFAPIFNATANAETGLLGVGVARRSGRSSGAGVVARIEFVLDATAPDGESLQLSLGDVVANDADGTPLTLTPSSRTIEVNGVPNPVPTLTGIVPNRIDQGATLQSTLTGTGFFRNITSVSIDGNGLVVDSLRVDTPRQLTAWITADASTAPGPRSVSVTNGLPGGGTSEAVSLTVNDIPDRPLPILESIAPAEALQGDTLTVRLTGRQFVPGVSTVSLISDDVVIDSVSATSSTQIEAVLRVAPTAAVGSRVLRVETPAPGGGLSQGVSFAVLDATPRPDLVVEQVSAPSRADFGTDVEVEWTVQNTGNAGTGSTTWYDRVLISPTPQVVAGASVVVATVPNLTALTASGTAGSGYVNRATVRIPDEIVGTYYVVVDTDRFRSVGEWSEANNVGASSTLTVEVPPLPNLVVTDVVAPSNAFSGDTLTVSWTVRNDGSASTIVDRWDDSIFLSDDATLDFLFIGGRGQHITILDTYLVSHPRSGRLAPGDSYTASADVVLPLRESGTMTLFAAADLTDRSRSSRVYEYVSELDNWTGATVNVTLRPPPNLEVTDVQVPSSVTSGDTLLVQWTVTNTGPGPTVASRWVDAVYLAPGTTTDPSSGRRMAGKVRTTSLAPGESYTAEAPILTTEQQTGPYTVIVTTDYTDVVFEAAQEGDNDRESDPVEFIPEPPDLVVSSVSYPMTVQSGAAVVVQWTVENQGIGAVDDTRWIDRVWLSPTASFSRSTAVEIAAVSREDVISPGGQYAAAASAPTPLGLEGAFYIFVETDATDRVFEFTPEAEANNVSTTGTAITLEQAPWADLRVTAAELPESARTGESAVLQWTVTNAGPDPASRLWTDRIYLSASTTWSPSDASPIGEADAPIALKPQETYTASTLIRLPETLTERLYLYVVVDDADDVFEYTAENNNVYQAGSIAPPSSLPPPDGGDAIIVAPADSQDVAVHDVTAPSDGGTRQEVTVEWTVTNTYPGPTSSTQWNDEVYLSPDRILDSQSDVLLGSARRVGPLAGASSYRQTASFTIPSEVVGSYFTIVRSAVEDDDATNNVSVAPSAIDVRRTPAADLTVTAVEAPSASPAGQPLVVRWTVQNTGDGTPGPDRWRDAVYISSDAVVNPGDRRLAVVPRSQDLAPSASYTAEAEIELPSAVGGDWYLVVRTDDAGEVYQDGRRSNDLRSRPIFVTTPPPGDLVVTGVTVPDRATPGEAITVSWTLENRGENPVSGRLRDAVYVSSDRDFQLDDPLVGTVERTVTIPAGATSTLSTQVDLAKTLETTSDGTVIGELPGVVPGSYYAIVRTDVRNNIVESVEDNNASASTSTVMVDVDEILLGSNVDSTLAGRGNHLFRIPTPRGETVVIRARSLTPESPPPDIFVAYSRPATTTDYDAASRSTSALSTASELVIPSTLAGTYYLLLRNAAGHRTRYALTAGALDFEISSVDTNRGGNTGTVTVEIRGARFDTSATAILEQPGVRLESTWTALLDASRLFARFDLTDAPLGVYDVKVRQTDAQTTKRNAFTVETGQSADIDVYVRVPAATRAGRLTKAIIAYRNSGNVDVSFPARYVFNTGESPVFTLDPSDTSLRSTPTRYLYLELLERGGPPDVLRPRASGERVIYVRALRDIQFQVVVPEDL